MRTAKTVTEQVKPLEIKFPKEFDIQPDIVIELPANCRALLYKVKYKVEEYVEVDGKSKRVYTSRDAYRIITVNKNGRTPRVLLTADNRYQRLDPDCRIDAENKLDIRRHIERVAWALSKVKVTTVQEDDSEIE